MSYQPVGRFMAGQSMTKGTVVILKGDYVIMMDVTKDFVPFGVLKEDCVMGDIVEVYTYGRNF